MSIATCMQEAVSTRTTQIKQLHRSHNGLQPGAPSSTGEGLPFVKMISLPCFRNSSPLRYSSPLTAYSAFTKSSLSRSGCKTYRPAITESQLCLSSAVSVSFQVCHNRVCSTSRLKKNPRRHYVHDFMSMYLSQIVLQAFL